MMLLMSHSTSTQQTIASWPTEPACREPRDNTADRIPHPAASVLSTPTFRASSPATPPSSPSSSSATASHPPLHHRTPHHRRRQPLAKPLLPAPRARHPLHPETRVARSPESPSAHRRKARPVRSPSPLGEAQHHLPRTPEPPLYPQTPRLPRPRHLARSTRQIPQSIHRRRNLRRLKGLICSLCPRHSHISRQNLCCLAHFRVPMLWRIQKSACCVHSGKHSPRYPL